MQIVILCGGRGIRLNEMTEFIPKPMVQIGGWPIIAHIMARYLHYFGNECEFILPIGYKGEIIREYFKGYKCVHCIETGDDTPTGGRLRAIAPYLRPDAPFMLTYGDNVANIDLATLLAFHRSHGKSITLTAVNPPSRFGVLDIAPDNHVIRFEEKPKSDWVNGGFMVCKQQVAWATLTSQPFEYTTLVSLARAGQVMARHHYGFWHTMDTYRDYLDLNKIWRESGGKPPWLDARRA